MRGRRQAGDLRQRAATSRTPSPLAGKGRLTAYDTGHGRTALARSTPTLCKSGPLAVNSHHRGRRLR